MVRYVFGSQMENRVVSYVRKSMSYGGVQPFDVLVPQFDLNSLKRMLECQEEGIVKEIFLDSGAFSVHTGKHPEIDVDQYIDFVNSMSDKLMAFVQVDTIPGQFGKPKHPQDYVESAQQSWDNFLYMYPKMLEPGKLLPVVHYGESVESLRRILDWRGDRGEKVEYLALSPANDSHQKYKDMYLQGMFNVIKSSTNPDVKVHLLAMTSLESLPKFNPYSTDSVSHRLIAAFGQIRVPKYGIIQVSTKEMSRSKSHPVNFFDVADTKAKEGVLEFITRTGLTLQEVQEHMGARVSINIYFTQQMMKEMDGVVTKVLRPKSLI